MPTSHRRSRDKTGTLVVNTAAKEFETSNMTMTQFLGGAQKSWMTGIQGVATIQSPEHPSGSTETGTGGPINAKDQTREVASGNQQDPTSAQAHAENDPNTDTEHITPLKSKANVVMLTTSDEKSTTVEPISANPISPNEQTKQKVTQIIDLEAEVEEIQQVQTPALHKGSAQKDDQASRLNELAHRYGGIEELEKILRITQSPSRNESPKSSSPGAVPDPSHVASRKRVQAEEAPLRKRMQPLQISVPGRSTQQISSSVVLSPKSSFPSPSGSLPSSDDVRTFTQQISDRRNLPGNNNFTEFHRRLILLKDAFLQKDHAFIILHQLLCMGPTMAAIIHAPVILQLEHQGGLQVLSVLLANNHISPDDLAWLATFPLPMEQLLKKWPGLNEIYEKVFVCLAKLEQEWPGAFNSCINRCYPLLVDEMKEILGTNSSILQLLISRHIFEKIWPDLEDECFSEGYKLCMRNQQEVQARASTGGTGLSKVEIIRYNSAFAQEYKDLWNKHQQHIQLRQLSQQGSHPGSRSVSINSPMVPMAPPQQLPGSFVSAMQDFSVQSNRVQGRQDIQWRGIRAGSASTPATPVHHVQSSVPSTSGLDMPILVPSSPITTNGFDFTTGTSSTTTYCPSPTTTFLQSPGFMHYPDARTVHHGQTTIAAQTYNYSEAPTANPPVSSVQPARTPLYTNMPNTNPQHGQSPRLGGGPNVSDTTTSPSTSFIPNSGSMYTTQNGQVSNMAQSFNYSSAQTGYIPVSSFQPTRPMQQFTGPNLQYGQTFDPRNGATTIRPQTDLLQPSRPTLHSNVQRPQNARIFDARNTPETARQQGDPLQLHLARPALRSMVRAPLHVQTTESRNSTLPTQPRVDTRASQSGSSLPYNSSNLPPRRNETFFEPNNPSPWNSGPQNNRGTFGAQTQGEVPSRPPSRPVSARPQSQAIPVQPPSQSPLGFSEAPISQQILPPHGYCLSPTVPPNPALTAIHQAQATSPIYSAVDASGKSDGKDAFAFIKMLSVMPKRLGATLNHFKWVFEMAKEKVYALAEDNESSNGPPTRTVCKGSQYLRLRSIKGASDANLGESDLVVGKNTWPPGVAALLNGKVLEFRRKAHYGEDLPVDVTRYVKEGENILQIVFCNTKDIADSSYTIGLETIEITDSSTIKEGLTKLDAQDSLTRILRPAAVDPEELEVVGTTVLLDLTDPHTSQIFSVPVRGETCRHTQCFDLDIFLQTRRRKAPTYPSMPDHFKCPVCGADARPQSLLLDMYFVKLRAELEVMNRLDAKTVILDEHGAWKIKEEVIRMPKP